MKVISVDDLDLSPSIGEVKEFLTNLGWVDLEWENHLWFYCDEMISTRDVNLAIRIEIVSPK